MDTFLHSAADGLSQLHLPGRCPDPGNIEGEQSFPVIEKHAKKQGILVIAPGPCPLFAVLLYHIFNLKI